MRNVECSMRRSLRLRRKVARPHPCPLLQEREKVPAAHVRRCKSSLMCAALADSSANNPDFKFEI